jgi:polyphosphate kinase
MASRRYVHLATSATTLTSRIYTDLSFFTCDSLRRETFQTCSTPSPLLSQAGLSQASVAPRLERDHQQRVEREIERQKAYGDGQITMKMNALVDKSCIQALYRASQAGVPIELQVRGICCLRPRVSGVSETIRVTSIVGRFLEHTRIFHFHNGGEDDVLLGSADLMPRNLDRRVETLFPIESPELRRTIIDDILRTHLRDNVQAKELVADGTYVPTARDRR